MGGSNTCKVWSPTLIKTLRLKDEFQSVLRNLRPAMFVSLTRRKVNTAKIQNSGANLPFSSLLMPDILAKQ